MPPLEKGLKKPRLQIQPLVCPVGVNYDLNMVDTWSQVNEKGYRHMLRTRAHLYFPQRITDRRPGHL